MGIKIKQQSKKVSDLPGYFVTLDDDNGFYFIMDEENEDGCYTAVLFNSSGIPDCNTKLMNGDSIVQAVYNIVKGDFEIIAV